MGAATPGCSDAAVEQCVCAEDDYCCTTEWNDECVGLVDALGCGSCGGSAGSSTSSGGPAGDCCTASPSTGCGDPAIEECVCQQDDSCCTTEWNEQCVEQVDELGCGFCGGSAASGGSGGNPGGECCSPSGMPGCMDQAVEQCVCAQDDYCCTTAWDDTCVLEIGDFGCGAC